MTDWRDYEAVIEIAEVFEVRSIECVPVPVDPGFWIVADAEPAKLAGMERDVQEWFAS